MHSCFQCCCCMFSESSQHEMNFLATTFFMSIYGADIGNQMNSFYVSFIHRIQYEYSQCQCFQGNINQFIELQLADFNYKIPFHKMREVVCSPDTKYEFGKHVHFKCVYRFIFFYINASPQKKKSFFIIIDFNLSISCCGPILSI